MMIKEIDDDFLDQMANEIHDLIWDNKSSNNIPEGQHGCLTIIDYVQTTPTQPNYKIVGGFWYKGEEYLFNARSGNSNGFEWVEIA